MFVMTSRNIFICLYINFDRLSDYRMLVVEWTPLILPQNSQNSVRWCFRSRAGFGFISYFDLIQLGVLVWCGQVCVRCGCVCTAYANDRRQLLTFRIDGARETAYALFVKILFFFYECIIKAIIYFVRNFMFEYLWSRNIWHCSPAMLDLDPSIGATFCSCCRLVYALSRTCSLFK